MTMNYQTRLFSLLAEHTGLTIDHVLGSGNPHETIARYAIDHSYSLQGQIQEHSLRIDSLRHDLRDAAEKEAQRLRQMEDMRRHNAIALELVFGMLVKAVGPDAVFPAEASDYLKQGNHMIEAIKVLRRTYDLGLSEAKNLAEAYTNVLHQRELKMAQDIAADNQRMDTPVMGDTPATATEAVKQLQNNGPTAQQVLAAQRGEIHDALPAADNGWEHDGFPEENPKNT